MVDPRVIITLGRFSMSKWFPQQAISRIHGSVKEADGRLIVPMYHPAAALHQGNLRQVLLDDFARVPAILERARGTLTPRPPLPSLGEGEEMAAGEPVPASAFEQAIGEATGKSRWDVDFPGRPDADSLTPRPPLPSLGEGEERALADSGQLVPRAADLAARVALPVVSGAESAMMDGSEHAAASPRSGFEPENRPTDVAPAESPDSSAAGKTEQIRLFD